MKNYIITIAGTKAEFEMIMALCEFTDNGTGDILLQIREQLNQLPNED